MTAATLLPDPSVQQTFKLPWEKRWSDRADFDLQALSVRVPAELARQLEVVSRQNDTGMETFCLTAWLVLLWRLTGQTELTTGIVISGRKAAPLQHPPGWRA